MENVTFYAIDARIKYQTGAWTRTQCLPIFYLNANLMGILNEAQAVRIATEIIGDRGGNVSVQAVRL